MVWWLVKAAAELVEARKQRSVVAVRSAEDTIIVTTSSS